MYLIVGSRPVWVTVEIYVVMAMVMGIEEWDKSILIHSHEFNLVSNVHCAMFISDGDAFKLIANHRTGSTNFSPKRI